MFCFIARRNPLSGCYPVDAPVTWSNYKEIDQIIYIGKQDPEANSILTKGEILFVIILVAGTIIALIKVKQSKSSS